ncbi:tRNA (guanine-N(7)-)-methyltransferase like protein [Argiope bruennichi]|uniref:tRNA (guanine(46)-N(7))-methyltransferase n=1 Tax=Argiope bruennichi TaxID=94029 RepID=A0A8T0EGK2_ARGBR|nr:tRNA (guanine-N(7)-)-methyltransferase like protein [Argiope bruennichi]
MNWAPLYPKYFGEDSKNSEAKVEFADIGCGYGGLLDVKELHEWMVKHLDAHPLFQKIPEDELAKDPVVDKIFESSEEAKKVSRNKGDKFLAVYVRIEDPFSIKAEPAGSDGTFQSSNCKT